MKIKHYLYNAFIVESGETKIAIDPGLDAWIFKFNHLIPKTEWPGITHILVTHGDIDHYWSPDKIAGVSNAHFISGKDLVRKNGSGTYILDPRTSNIRYSTPMNKVSTLDWGESVQLDGVTFEAHKAVHGPLAFKALFGLIKKTETPGPGERIGIGSTAFKVTLSDEKTFVNMGDTLLLLEEWEGLKASQPDVLMLPIGGREVPNTVNETEALEIVKWIEPKMVIPCHYNNDFVFFKNINPADDELFKREVEKLGFACNIMKYGDELIV